MRRSVNVSQRSLLQIREVSIRTI
ncbi:protein of unknown function [Candidatus Hydrogenisulfobacillus filiaventi]|uniref:Uncharacterized protein n=1 Tax=Candidatus Hydrogenisulfobacillus filiaventi TaxID=2707344 RepID=A0A6F8ZCE9_9FIRM|nr:protein of unknown function [Candidatus Hydrogenisulfobacillus filiaventi]